MKRATFTGGVWFALLASLGAGILFAVLGTVFSNYLLLKAVIAGLGLAYIVYLLRCSTERTGRIVMMTLWIGVSATAWVLAPNLSFFALTHVGMIWIIRALYFHAGVLAALIDLGLSSFAFAAALWTSWQTDSLFLTVWSFFLVQALFSSIPGQFGRKPHAAKLDTDTDDGFLQAHRAAEAAVRKLSTIN